MQHHAYCIHHVYELSQKLIFKQASLSAAELFYDALQLLAFPGAQEQVHELKGGLLG